MENKGFLVKWTHPQWCSRKHRWDDTDTGIKWLNKITRQELFECLCSWGTNTFNNATPHCTALHPTHQTTLHCTALHYTTLHRTVYLDSYFRATAQCAIAHLPLFSLSLSLSLSDTHTHTHTHTHTTALYVTLSHTHSSTPLLSPFHSFSKK